MSFYREQLEGWLKTIDVKANRVLDVGGSANTIKGRTKSWDVKEYKILDNNNEKDWHDKWTEPDYVYDICTRKPLFDPEELGKFDVIFCLEVAEYWTNANNAVANIYKLLRSGGFLYISFPSLYPCHNPLQQDRLRFTRSWIEWALQGYEEVEIIPRVATEGRAALADFYSLERMRAAKTEDIFNIGYMAKCQR